MLEECQQWTKVADHKKRLVALQKAYRWAVRRVFNTENGPNLLAVFGEELSALGSITKTLDIESLLSHELLGFKQLWLMLPSDIKFTPMLPRDTNDQAFIDSDTDPLASLTVAQGHPVVFDIINFGSARFAPALPVGAKLRVDYYRVARTPGETDSGHSDSSDEDDEPVVGEDLPAVFDDAVTSKGISLLFGMLDDDREAVWEQRALSELTDAIYTAGSRIKAPTRTKPFRVQRRRFI